MTTLPKIFITGATGYIGGDALYAIFAKHPEYKYTVLVRSPEKAGQVQAQYPSIRVVIGDLDDSALLEKESAEADIVLHTADASDHEGAANAIAKGLLLGHSKEKPGYWLHTGGTGILTFHDTDRNVFGEGSDKVYDDWDGVDELLNLPDHAFHRNVDRVVLETAKVKGDVVKTALVCPPTIYGRGRGPVSVRGRQVYELAKVTLQLKKAPLIGDGKSIWNNIHIHDLSELYVLLVEAAVHGRDDPELWGERAYYLTENGEHVWGELAVATALTATELGLLPGVEKEKISLEDAKKFGGYEALSWGLNSRGRARRGAKVLGWTPTKPSIEATLPEILEDEVKRMTTQAQRA
ncbi:nucleoside-diphosphate-sugar epimerase [Aspergillus eucalypticola CBS 122712]|uniref:Nucleoside-diphosphate-sugar epimerase n=1 Tax=Aspergillus eucalypticola (strain CBS 122712 / IBT 29274) TaxID=1448314 RepID=A0A317VX25_ASPEC|nr:nucleoside-diphosphate-sugar epimerase [Aspergillus eucalypticola CBS 122712]PWY78946.1 nucleoside-diphosphate-sugar epimerase [Aspergillus eucalypticola CBS 122712]